VAKRVSTGELRNWARAGAKARIQELSAEIQRIKAAFPSEFGARGGQKTARKKRRLSAAGRKAISDAAKARWARERAGKKK
jgi:hypothetical protein